MVRKWSYINSTNSTPRNFSINTQFKFKIFRKNTRFKKSNLRHTFFVRKLEMLRRRRMGYSTYFNFSSLWALQFLKLKKLSNFIQTKYMFTYSTASLYSGFLLGKKTNLPTLIGKGRYALNVNFIKNSIFFKNSKKITPTTQFNTYGSVTKLNQLGFSFTYLLFQNQLPITPRVIPLYTHSITTFPLILLKLVSLRMVYIYLTLFYMYNQ
jgi:hypothetical protein